MLPQAHGAFRPSDLRGASGGRSTRFDGAPGGGPVKVGVALTDVLTGMYAASAILAALAWRERSGRGFSDDLQIHLVELPKSRASSHNVGGVSPLERWAFLLLYAHRIDALLM